MAGSGDAVQRGLGGFSQSFSVAYNTALQHNLEAQVNEERKRQFDAEAPVRAANVNYLGAQAGHLGVMDQQAKQEMALQPTPEEAAQTRSLQRTGMGATNENLSANAAKTRADTLTKDEITLRRDEANARAGLGLTQVEQARQNLAASSDMRKLEMASKQSEIDDRTSQAKYRDNMLKMQGEQNSAQRLQWEHENDLAIGKLSNEALATASHNAELEMGRQLRHLDLAYGMAPHILQAAVNSGLSFTAARDEASTFIQKLVPGIEVAHDAKASMSLAPEQRKAMSDAMMAVGDPSLTWSQKIKAVNTVNTIARMALPNMSADDSKPPPPPPPPTDSRPSSAAESRATRTLLGAKEKADASNLAFAQQFESVKPELYQRFLKQFADQNSLTPDKMGAKYADFAKWLRDKFSGPLGAHWLPEGVDQ